MLKTVTNSINASQIQTPITLPGDVTLSTGNLVIGTSGKGIDFSATPGTGTSELLADYEEGTWTPVLVSTSGAIASYTATGTYTKIGNTVFVAIRILITDNGTGAGALIISNFPFASKTSTTMAGATREDQVSGIGIVTSASTSTSIYLSTVTNTYPVTTGCGFSLCLTYNT